MVLRHRVAGDGRAAGPADRRSPGGLGRRPRLAGRRRLDGGRRPARRVADAGPAPQRPAPRPLERGGGRPAPALRGRGRRLHARVPVPLRCLAAASRRLRCQCRRHGDRHPLQHGRAPGALPHHRRSGPTRPTLRRRRGPVPGEPRPHDPRAGGRPIGRPVGPARRAGGPHRGQHAGRRLPVRCPAGLDLPPERPCRRRAGVGPTEVAR